MQNKIPFYIQGGQNFYIRREVKILLDYLRVINDPDSDEADDALLNILNAPVRYISNKSKSELKEFCNKKDIHLYQGLKETRFDTPFIRKNIREFITFMDAMIESVDTFTIQSELPIPELFPLTELHEKLLHTEETFTQLKEQIEIIEDMNT